MSETSEPSVDVRGTSIAYDVRESDRAKKARIDVDLNGVTVVVPAGTSMDPADLLRRNAAWVLEKEDDLSALRERIPERRFEPGETFPYLGDAHEVVVERRSASAVEDGTFRLAEHHVEETSIQRALETLYRRKARERYEDLAARYAPAMGVEYERIEIRNQQTKWGSCSSSGTLSLNWRVLLAPSEISEYIVIHELAHLEEPNHSENFWELVERHDPDYRAHAEWLDEHSTRLIFSEEDW